MSPTTLTEIALAIVLLLVGWLLCEAFVLRRRSRQRRASEDAAIRELRRRWEIEP